MKTQKLRLMGPSSSSQAFCASFTSANSKPISSYHLRSVAILRTSSLWCWVFSYLASVGGDEEMKVHQIYSQTALTVAAWSQSTAALINYLSVSKMIRLPWTFFLLKRNRTLSPDLWRHCKRLHRCQTDRDINLKGEQNKAALATVECNLS